MEIFREEEHMGQADSETSVHRLPRRWFPLLIEALHPTTRAVLWATHVEKPEDYEQLVIPPLSRTYGHRIVVRVQFGKRFVLEAGESRVV